MQNLIMDEIQRRLARFQDCYAHAVTDEEKIRFLAIVMELERLAVFISQVDEPVRLAL